MLTFCCINAGNYQGRGADYVNILFDMVRRNLSDELEGKFVCFTDAPEGMEEGIEVRPLLHEGLHGFYNKLALFKPGVFEDGERVIFSDLDNLITGRLDEIFAYDGEFAILRNVLNPMEGFGSAFISWRAGPATHHIWTSFERAGFPECELGDQEWIQRCMSGAKVDYWQDMFPGKFISARVLGNKMPDGASIVAFHGPDNKPHLINGGWIAEVWKIGGISHVDLDQICNTENEKIIANFKSACERDIPWFDLQEAHDGIVVICGGGPSLKDGLADLQTFKSMGAQIWALNAADWFLRVHGIESDVQVILDARFENAGFINPFRMPYARKIMLASQCDPWTFEKGEHARQNGAELVLYHNATEGIAELLEKMPGEKPAHLLGGGSSVGLKAMLLAYFSGFRKLHLYGMDGCYIDGAHHSYPQDLNEGERALTVICEGRVFQCAPWMATQAKEFDSLIDTLVENDCSISVAGDGLLAWMIRKKSRPVTLIDGKFIEVEGWLTPYGDERSVQMLRDNTASDVAEVLKYCEDRAVVVQAGGHVGIWPKELARHFREVWTFEADPLNFEALTRNVAPREGEERNIYPVDRALGDKPGRATIAFEGKWNSSGRYVVPGDGEIEFATIDDLNLTACDALCLDVEGFEKNALMGAADTIRKFRPVITIEDNGLSARYGVAHGETPEWLCQEFGYVVKERYRMDILLIPQERS